MATRGAPEVQACAYNKLQSALCLTCCVQWQLWPGIPSASDGQGKICGPVRLRRLLLRLSSAEHQRIASGCFQVTLSAKGSVGSLEVILPRSHLAQCRAHESSIAFRYPYKFMKSALSGVAGRVDVSSEISIDANGMFRVR
jgi:hypothetical protein